MGWFQEERAEAFRLALGIDGFPEREHMAQLAEFLGELLTIRRGRIPRPKYFQLQGQALILLPEGLPARQIDAAVFHEATHHLLAHGAAVLFREHADPDDPRQRRIAEVWETREEREVEDFLLAWLLPSRLVCLIRTEADLVEQSGCVPELVRLRKERLRGKTYSLTAPPRWSAWWHFRLSRWESASLPTLRVRSRRDRALVFEIPATLDTLDALQWRLNAELIALAYDEFCAKYRHFEARGSAETDASLSLSELSRWAARFGRLSDGTAESRMR